MNIFDLPPLPLAEELTTRLAESGNARIERIISTGQVSDWYDQAETEFVALLEGNAVIEYENDFVVEDQLRFVKGFCEKNKNKF